MSWKRECNRKSYAKKRKRKASRAYSGKQMMGSFGIVDLPTFDLRKVFKDFFKGWANE